jgi:hypothetical protein
MQEYKIQVDLRHQQCLTRIVLIVNTHAQLIVPLGKSLKKHCQKYLLFYTSDMGENLKGSETI